MTARVPSVPWTLRVAADAVLLGLLVFTPLAFGSVQPWAVAAIIWGAVIAFLLWMARRLWFPHSEQDGRGIVAAATGGLRALGVGTATAGFLALIVLQLLPLPPVAVRALSPGTWDLYQRTLPGYAEGKAIDFGRLEEWLLGDTGERGAAESPFAGAADGALRFWSWRPLSLAPASTRRAAALILAYLMVFVVVADRCQDRGFRRLLLWVVASTGLLVALLGLAQRTTWGDRIYGRIRPAYGGSPMGPFVNSNHYAGYLEMAVAALAGLWFALVRRERQPIFRRATTSFAAGADSRHAPQLFILTMLLGIGILGLWGARSRGGLIGGAVGGLILLAPAVRRWGRGKGWTRALVLAGILAFLVLVGSKVYEVSMAEGLESDLSAEPSFLMRLRVWRDSLGMLLQFPAFGGGLGAYGFTIPLFQSGGYDRLWIYAHNDYLQLVCETGLAGALLFGWGFARFLWRGLRPVVLAPPRPGAAALGCAAGMGALLVHSLVDFNLQIPSNGLLFVVLGAVLQSYLPGRLGNRAAEGQRPAPRPPAVLFIGCAGAGVLLCLGAATTAAARGLADRASARYAEGDLHVAERHLSVAARLGSRLPDVHADRGFFYLRALDERERAEKVLGLRAEEMLRRARAAFCRAILLGPTNTNSWSGLAETYLEASHETMRTRSLEIGELLSGRPAPSRLEKVHLALLRRMMALEPRNGYHHARLGDFHWDRQNRDAALRAYEEAMRLLPKVDQHPFLAGDSVPPEVLQAALRGARAALEAESPAAPEHELHLNVSLLLERSGDLAGAVRHMERARELLPRKEWYLRRLAYLCFAAGELDRSRELLLQSVEGGVRSEHSYLYLARIARQKGDRQEAISYFRKALNMRPDDVRLALELARAYEEFGDARNASRYYELAMEMDPSDLTALLAGADFFERRGLPGRAVQVLQKVVALRPRDDVYQRRLEQLRSRLGTIE
jgi:tetratricopeptide (TPR) repeat protein